MDAPADVGYFPLDPAEGGVEQNVQYLGIEEGVQYLGIEEGAQYLGVDPSSKPPAKPAAPATAAPAPKKPPVSDAYLMVTPDGYLDDTTAPVASDMGYLAVQPDWLGAQWDMMATQPWFCGQMDRGGATRKLGGKPVGNFVVRVSSEPGHYAISAVTPSGTLDHMLILPSWAPPESNAPGQTQYRLGTMSKTLFNTVPKMIAFYIGHPYHKDKYLVGEVKPESQAGGYLMVCPD